MDLSPRQKFNFTLQIQQFDQSIVNFYKVSNVTQPSFNFDNQVMNQYNRKRVVQTRMNYDPVTVTFYDTFDDQWYNMMNEYIAHYYHGGDGIRQRIQPEGESTIIPNFQTYMGYTPNSTRNFFPEIRIIQNGIHGRHRGWILKQPYITAISGDTLDYSDSNPVMWTVTFQPESVQTYVEATQFETLTGTRNP
jgi:hypothetical protein